MLKSVTYIILTVLFPILAGSFIYYFFRFSSHRSLQHSFTTNFILYNLPDGLWFYALLSSLKVIWKDGLLTKGLYWLLFVCIVVPFTEILQLFHLLPGTFDWLDLLSYGLSFVLFSTQLKSKFTHINSIAS